MADDKPAAAANQLVVITQGRPPMPRRVTEEFNIGPAEWRVLIDSIFPAAQTPESIVLALSYCRARKLDIMKRPIHVVPIWSKSLGRNVESVWPGIGELRTTASRTGVYAGIDEVKEGPEMTRTFEGKTYKGEPLSATVTFPTWASVAVYRLVHAQRVKFQGPKVYWLETYSAIGKSGVPNEMWARRSRGQLAKCAEAAALRLAFPEECGGDIIADEAAGWEEMPPVIDLPPAQQLPEVAPEPEASVPTKVEKLAKNAKAKREAAEPPPNWPSRTDEEEGKLLADHDRDMAEIADAVERMPPEPLARPPLVIPIEPAKLGPAPAKLKEQPPAEAPPPSPSKFPKFFRDERFIRNLGTLAAKADITVEAIAAESERLFRLSPRELPDAEWKDLVAWVEAEVDKKAPPAPAIDAISAAQRERLKRYAEVCQLGQNSSPKEEPEIALRKLIVDKLKCSLENLPAAKVSEVVALVDEATK